MFIVKEAFEEITRGDKDAIAFLNAFYLYCHSRDDLIDQDKPVVVSDVVGFDLQLFHVLGSNAFFQKHQQFLMPIILMGALAYVVSEDKKRSPDVLERITAQVLKSEYANLFIGVAFLVGGFDHALACKRKYHQYSFDDEKPVV